MSRGAQWNRKQVNSFSPPDLVTNHILNAPTPTPIALRCLS
ncbi:hypothetical protein Vi05172_g3347 [Venturia inaequalis]|nr:hypothetical protein Vi05172_g3347 [Venturia inaequalis]